MLHGIDENLLKAQIIINKMLQYILYKSNKHKVLVARTCGVESPTDPDEREKVAKLSTYFMHARMVLFGKD